MWASQAGLNSEILRVNGKRLHPVRRTPSAEMFLLFRRDLVGDFRSIHFVLIVPLR